MKKKITTFGLMILLTLSYSITAFAAVKTMPDGQKFDPVYYAEQNEDVVKAVGKTEEALYKHYVDYGKAEGRLPYKDAPKPETKKSDNTATVTKSTDTRAATTNNTSQKVYITKTGKCYHNAGCSSLKKSKIETTLDEAKKKGLTACKNCH